MGTKYPWTRRHAPEERIPQNNCRLTTFQYEHLFPKCIAKWTQEHCKLYTCLYALPWQYPCTNDTNFRKNPTNILYMLTPLYSHYTLTHVSALKGSSSGILTHYVSRVNKMCPHLVKEQRIILLCSLIWHLRLDTCLRCSFTSYLHLDIYFVDQAH